jgi:endonuclease/exonuclease/phosphatase family metal-dependent hydrolase
MRGQITRQASYPPPSSGLPASADATADGGSGINADNRHNAAGQRSLRLLSYNIQTGVASQRYRHYLTRGLRHVMPHSKVVRNLNHISALVSRFDIVALQEVDAGSLRTGFINQTEYLAHRSGFPHWYSQTNRSLGRLAQVSIGLLSQLQPSQVTEHRLPGPPGRGLMVVRIGHGENALHLLILHLSLGRRARSLQLGYVREIVQGFRHSVLMGDFNAPLDSPEMCLLVDSCPLQAPSGMLHTFPSWQPRRGLDHILVSEHLQVIDTHVVQQRYSDHLPLAVELLLPAGMLI